ncbi:hypothetical protein [Labilibaculum sp.]|uniref:hypothetical protein n=1 Tax=Labilibaculum sp. TaxID=2060723 RepID=UPI00356B3EF6
MKLKFFFLFIIIPIFSYPQSKGEFEQIYSKGEEYLHINYDSCINCVLDLKRLTNKSELQIIRIDLLDLQANYQILSIDSSQKIVNNCLKRLSKIEGDHHDLKARLLILIGAINSANSNVYEGIPQLMEAWTLLENSEDNNLREYCRISIVEAHRVKKQFKIGFDLLYTTLKQPELSDRNRAFAYSRLAAYYEECGTGEVDFSNTSCNPLDSTLFYSERSLELAQKCDHRDLMALAYNQIGHYILHKTTKYDSAIVYLSKAVKIFKELGYYADYVNTSNNLSNAYLKKGDFTNAILIGDQLLSERQGKEYPQIYRKTYQFLSDSYDSIGNYKLSKKYFKQVYLIEKNLFKTYLNKEVTALSTKYNYQLKEAQLSEEKQKSNYRLTLFLGIFIIIITLLIIAIVINRMRKMSFMQKQQQLKSKNAILQNNIIHQNKTLTMNTLRFVKNNSLLNEISQQVGAMEYLNKADLKAAIQKLISEIRVSKKQEIWKDFEKSFQEVHPDFYKNLTLKHSDLSAKELRLSAFLKLNLTSKEIAVINGNSLRTVETARHRLRKKIDVSEETDLNSYFQQF